MRALDTLMDGYGLHHGGSVAAASGNLARSTSSRLPGWGRLVLKALSSWRYHLGVYSVPWELKGMQQFINLRKPKEESL